MDHFELVAQYKPTYDVEAVRVIVDILRKLDIVLCDSIIVAGENYYSMADRQKFAHLFDY